MKDVRERPDLEAHLEDTIPPEGFLDTRFFFEKVTEITLKLVGNGTSGKVLDMAAGLGVDTKKLSEQGLDIVAMEPSERMVKFAALFCKDINPMPAFVRGYSEELPFIDNSFDTVLIKGSMDHFLDPAETMIELKRVLKPDGKAIIAVANFDSLSAKTSYLYHELRGIFTTRPPAIRPHHEMPADHITRFTRKNIIELIRRDFTISKEVGVSLLWSAPFWGRFIETLPESFALRLLQKLDRGARLTPGLADMLIYVIHPKPSHG